MTSFASRLYSSRLIRSFALSIFVAAASFTTANAQTTTFAQVLQQIASQDFVFVNNGGASGSLNTVPGGTPVFFFYSNIVNLPAPLTGPQFAQMTVTTTTTAPGFTGGGNVTQPLNQTVTIAIIRTTPAPAGVGFGTRTNLLTAVIAPAAQTPGIVGSDGGNSATFSATTPDHTVTFSSDFISFNTTTQRNLGFSFSSVNPGFALGAGNFLQSLTAAGTGTFASDPAPLAFGPTAADVSIAGRVLGANGQGLANAEVLVTRQNGQVRIARTSNFGYFEMSGLEGGEAVVVNVRSKKHSYPSQVVSLEDSALDLVFTPNL